MNSKIWYDGELVEWSAAHAHVMTHTLHYGSGAFEGIRFYNTTHGRAVFRLVDHIKRFFYSMSVLRMECKWSDEKLLDAVGQVVRSFPAKEGYVRPIAFYGEGMGLVPKSQPHIVIGAWEWGAYLGKECVAVQVAKKTRISPNITDPRAKLTGNYLNSILACFSIDRERFDEAILLDHRGYVAEGPGENICAVKDGTLLVPTSDSILPGITRATIMTLAKEEGINVVEKPMRLEELMACDEVFFCGTAVEVCAIGKIGGAVIGDGKMGELTALLKKRYLDEVRGQGKHEEWLYVVD